ncbi:MAG: hypothetical protein SFW62_01045 [Alphaproteobacteria bacterium]|nr:hypothetical protein [Alphaproteobacteria bacterium]
MLAAHQWIDFDTFVSRHGEHAALGLLENIERCEGIRHSEPCELETRWNAIMNHALPHRQMIAA